MTRGMALWVVLLGLGVGAGHAQSVHIVVPEGGSGPPGSTAPTYPSVESALAEAAPGDTIYVRGGTYVEPETLTLSMSGEEGSYLHVWAYPGETPVLDFATVEAQAVKLDASFVHLKGLVVQRAGNHGILIKGSNNIIERIVTREHGNSGLQIEDGAASNLVLNTDSYDNYDASNNGENADGFAAKFELGPGNIFRGCRAYGNSDDGFDFWEAGNGVTVEDSWSFNNGYNVWGDPDFQGDSNGFKLGHGEGAHVLVRNLAWGHESHGFDVNGNVTGVTLYNNTAYDNGGYNYFFDETSDIHVLRNNLSVGGDVWVYPAIDDEANSWNGFTVEATDLLSFDADAATAPRDADGSLPVSDFLRLPTGSPLAEAGMDVGLPYLGAAPDLGAYETETGTPTSVGDAVDLPSGVSLSPNYPNPFNPSTHIPFHLHRPEHVHLAVYDALGRPVDILLDAPLAAGRHTVEWNPPPHEHPSGVYFLRLTTPSATAYRRLVYVR